MLRLTEMQSQGHTTYPSSLPNIATVHSRACPPVPHGTRRRPYPQQHPPHRAILNIPYLHVITLPTHSLPTSGLTLLAGRQVRWTVSTPDGLLPPSIPEDTRKSLLLQIFTISRRIVNPPRPARDPCTIYNPAFQGNNPSDCYMLFRTATHHTLHRYLTRYEHRYQNTIATRANLLSPPPKHSSRS